MNIHREFIVRRNLVLLWRHMNSAITLSNRDITTADPRHIEYCELTARLWPISDAHWLLGVELRYFRIFELFLDICLALSILHCRNIYWVNVYCKSKPMQSAKVGTTKCLQEQDMYINSHDTAKQNIYRQNIYTSRHIAQLIPGQHVKSKNIMVNTASHHQLQFFWQWHVRLLPYMTIFFYPKHVYIYIYIYMYICNFKHNCYFQMAIE